MGFEFPGCTSASAVVHKQALDHFSQHAQMFFICHPKGVTHIALNTKPPVSHKESFLPIGAENTKPRPTLYKREKSQLQLTNHQFIGSQICFVDLFAWAVCVFWSSQSAVTALISSHSPNEENPKQQELPSHLCKISKQEILALQGFFSPLSSSSEFQMQPRTVIGNWNSCSLHWLNLSTMRRPLMVPLKTLIASKKRASVFTISNANNYKK